MDKMSSDLDTALQKLPTPVNVTIKSENFHHVLHWDPGPLTPPNTSYTVHLWLDGPRKRTKCPNQNITRCPLKLDNTKTYYLSVHATHSSHGESEQSPAITFTPSIDTHITAPFVSLAGCKNCIHVNISINVDVLKYYEGSLPVQIFWKKASDESRGPSSVMTSNASYTIANLETGTEYCIRVQANLRLNTNTQASDWLCESTTQGEPSRAAGILAAVSGAVASVVLVLLGVLCGLTYTGFMGHKTILPLSLLSFRVTGRLLLTPQLTVPQRVSGISEAQTRVQVQASQYQEEEEEDSDEDQHVYMDRPADCSSDSSSDRSSRLSQHAPGALQEHSGERSQEEATAEEEQPGAPPAARTGEAREEQQEEELWQQEQEDCGNVNLFSVLLVCPEEEEEEEGSLAEFLPRSPGPLLAGGGGEHRGTLASDTFASLLQPEEEQELSSYMDH